MDFGWSQEEQLLRAKLRELVARTVRPDWTLYDRDMASPAAEQEVRDFCRALAAEGLLTPHWPREYGGSDASPWESLVISEELWGAGEPRGSQYMNITWIGPAIMLAGTPEQKAFHLSRISAGESMWCQGFSEPGAGSDLAALRTRARRDGDRYVINGQKIWTSYAQAADYCFLLARTAGEPPSRDGISILLVPMDSPGIEVRDIPMMGFEHVVHEVFFDDVAVDADCLLGEENRGWQLIRTILANERVGLARHEHADRMLDRLVDEAEAAEIDVQTPERLEILGRIAARTAATRILNYVAVDESARRAPSAPGAASIYRTAMADMEHGVSHAYLDVLGTRALLPDSAGDYALLFSTTSTIASGTLEMQLNNVARNVLQLPRA